MIDLDIELDDPSWTAALPDAEILVKSALVAAVEDVGEEAEGAYVVLLADDETVRELNARFRGKDAATNVLSFPSPPSAAPHRGDLALAYGVCAREAEGQDKPLEHHLQHLVVHGVLHLLGFDHEGDSEAEAMEARERAILDGLGVPDPYAEAFARPGD